MTVPCNIARLGQVDYMEAWDLQKRLADEVREGRSEGWLLFLEHPHTYTFGRAGNADNLSLTPEQFDDAGAKVYWVDRGGDVTYHGPGQLIGYTVLDLKRWDRGARWYVQALEAALIDALASLGVKSEVVEGRPGVWSGDEKLAAIGLHIAHGITTHGFALNVDTDLDYFDHIDLLRYRRRRCHLNQPDAGASRELRRGHRRCRRRPRPPPRSRSKGRLAGGDDGELARPLKNRYLPLSDLYEDSSILVGSLLSCAVSGREAIQEERLT